MSHVWELQGLKWQDQYLALDVWGTRELDYSAKHPDYVQPGLPQ